MTDADALTEPIDAAALEPATADAPSASLVAGESTSAPAPKKPRAKRKRKKKGEVRIESAGDHLDLPEPDWGPLLALVGVGLTQDFMWMGAERLKDGTVLYIYKHRDTRANVHLTLDGRAFYYDWDEESLGGPYEYVETTRPKVLWGIFRTWRPGSSGFDEGKHKPLIDRAYDYADEGALMPVEPSYLQAYAAAEQAWKQVERLAEDLAADEREEGLRMRRIERIAYEAEGGYWAPGGQPPVQVEGEAAL